MLALPWAWPWPKRCFAVRAPWRLAWHQTRHLSHCSSRTTHWFVPWSCGPTWLFCSCWQSNSVISLISSCFHCGSPPLGVIVDLIIFQWQEQIRSNARFAVIVGPPQSPQWEYAQGPKAQDGHFLHSAASVQFHPQIWLLIQISLSQAGHLRE